ncbi:hypothetical protein NUW54_g5778 [Trametes sanguinea]|uniref:Uncharacterized protein n=1 Tax=Trametes sanguinea TaxID=158606 RepID=A0ACC1PXI9_9APHY|nr:hypothetical protein NUW54_g5778 [Trametes sanguinea]
MYAPHRPNVSSAVSSAALDMRTFGLPWTKTTVKILVKAAIDGAAKLHDAVLNCSEQAQLGKRRRFSSRNGCSGAFMGLYASIRHVRHEHPKIQRELKAQLMDRHGEAGRVFYPHQQREGPLTREDPTRLDDSEYDGGARPINDDDQPTCDAIRVKKVCQLIVVRQDVRTNVLLVLGVAGFESKDEWESSEMGVVKWGARSGVQSRGQEAYGPYWSLPEIFAVATPHFGHTEINDIGYVCAVFFWPIPGPMDSDLGLFSITSTLIVIQIHRSFDSASLFASRHVSRWRFLENRIQALVPREQAVVRSRIAFSHLGIAMTYREPVLRNTVEYRALDPAYPPTFSKSSSSCASSQAARRVSKPDIASHNCDIKSALQRRVLPVAKHALLYHSNLRSPRLVLLPARWTYDPACGCSAWPEDLDTDRWFEGSHVMASLDYFPGTDCRLKNGLDICFLARGDRKSRRRESNPLLLKMFALKWPGNLLVVKRGCRDPGRALHITASEVSLINCVVERCMASDAIETCTCILTPCRILFMQSHFSVAPRFDCVTYGLAQSEPEVRSACQEQPKAWHLSVFLSVKRCVSLANGARSGMSKEWMHMRWTSAPLLPRRYSQSYSSATARAYRDGPCGPRT